MLDALRKRAGGPLARILIAVLVVSFAIWGVNGVFNASAGNIVGRVGTSDITVTDFQRRYQEVMAQVAQFFGAMTPAQAEQTFGVTTIALQSLSGEATLNDQANRLGLGMSRETLDRAILADPSFQTAGGQFNLTGYRNYVQQVWGNEGAYRTFGRRPQELRSQIEEAVRGPTSPLPLTYQQAVHEYENEERTLLYAALTEAAIGELPAPTEEQTANFYQEDLANWMAPEVRTALVVEVTPEALADPAAVTGEQIQAAYETRKYEFGTPETRRVWWQQGLSAERAAAIQALLNTGATFDDLVLQGEIDPTDLGAVDAAYFGDPARALDPGIGEAVFDMALDGTTIVPGRFGRSTLVRVAGIDPAVFPPIDQIRDTLVQGVAEQQAAPRLAGLWEQMEDARAAGATLAEAAARVGLPTSTYTFDANGNDANGIPIPAIPGGAELANNVFQSDVGLADPPVDLAGPNSYVWYDVLSIAPEHQRTLDEVRTEVVDAWRDQETANRIQALADSIVTRVRNGENFYNVAAEHSLALEVANGIKRTSEPTGPLSDAAILEAFNGPRGHIGTANGVAEDDRVVLQVVDAVVPPFEPGAGVADQTANIRDQLATDLFLAYTLSAYRKAGGLADPNLDLISRVTGLPPPQ